MSSSTLLEIQSLSSLTILSIMLDENIMEIGITEKEGIARVV